MIEVGFGYIVGCNNGFIAPNGFIDVIIGRGAINGLITKGGPCICEFMAGIEPTGGAACPDWPAFAGMGGGCGI